MGQGRGEGGFRLFPINPLRSHPHSYSPPHYTHTHTQTRSQISNEERHRRDEDTGPTLPALIHSHSQVSNQERQLRDEDVKVEETKRLLLALAASAKAWTTRSNERSEAMAGLARALHVSVGGVHPDTDLALSNPPPQTRTCLTTRGP